MKHKKNAESVKKNQNKNKKKEVTKKLWPESTGSIQRWVQQVCSNKLYSNDLLEEIDSFSVSQVRKLFRKLRSIVDASSFEEAACVYEPSVHMTYAEFAVMHLLKRSHKSHTLYKST